MPVSDSELRQREQRAARLRAAWAFSGLTYAELAERADVGVDALMKWCAHRGPRRGRATDAEAFRVADAAGVPRWFVASGWDGALGVGDLVLAWLEGRADAEIRQAYAVMLGDRLTGTDGEKLLHRVLSGEAPAAVIDRRDADAELKRALAQSIDALSQVAAAGTESAAR